MGDRHAAPETPAAGHLLPTSVVRAGTVHSDRTAMVNAVAPGQDAGMMIPLDDPRLAPVHLRKDLLQSGYDDRALARALKRGTLARPRRGAYVDGALWAGLTTSQKHALTAHAAYLQARTDVVISHASALPFHDAPTWGIDLDEVHLTHVNGKTGRREAGVRPHCGHLVEGDVVTAYGIRFSTAIKVSLEVLTTAKVEPALAVVNHFLHRGDFTGEQLQERYRRGMDHWPHSLAAPVVFKLMDRRIESVAESRTSHLLWLHGLPPCQPQYEVRDGRGWLVAKLDFAWPELGVWLEFDGKVKYTELTRDGESAADVVVREKKREDLVRALTGWICVRITWADLDRPQEVVRRLREAFELAASMRAAAGR